MWLAALHVEEFHFYRHKDSCHQYYMEMDNRNEGGTGWEGGGLAVDGWGEYYEEKYRKTMEENQNKEGRRNRKKERIEESLREEKNTRWIRGERLIEEKNRKENRRKGDGTGKEWELMRETEMCRSRNEWRRTCNGKKNVSSWLFVWVTIYEWKGGRRR